MYGENHFPRSFLFLPLKHALDDLGPLGFGACGAWWWGVAEEGLGGFDGVLEVGEG